MKQREICKSLLTYSLKSIQRKYCICFDEGYKSSTTWPTIEHLQTQRHFTKLLQLIVFCFHLYFTQFSNYFSIIIPKYFSQGLEIKPELTVESICTYIRQVQTRLHMLCICFGNTHIFQHVLY